MNTAWLAPQDPRWSAALAGLAHDVYHLPEYVELAAGDEGGEAVAFWAEYDGHTMLVPLLERRLPESLGCDAIWHDAAGPYGYPAPLLSPGADVGSFVSAMCDAATRSTT